MKQRFFLSTRRASSARNGEEGMVTAFVVIFSAALILLAGLVLDGGMTLAAKARTINDADGAARAGAQALDVASYRSTGVFQLDPDRARQAAQDYLAAAGVTGTVDVEGDRVTVTAQKTQQMQILGIGGLGSVTVSGTGVAHASRGNAGGAN